jgi:hypothetical protein
MKKEDPGERAIVQLAGCLVAAEGGATGDNDVKKDAYGWSPAFEAVKKLRALVLGACVERVSNGQDFDACDEIAVVRVDGTDLLCRLHAERRLNRAELVLDAVRKALK